MAYYVRQVLVDVRNGRIRTEDGIKQIQSWHLELQPNINTTKGIVGLRAGVYQLFDALELCRSPATCVIGLPMAAHGANNVYENGSNLWTGRDDASGPVRKLYRYAAEELGGEAIDGDIKYGEVDIGLSLYSLLRRVPKNGAWKLFRRIPSDFERAYKAMGKGALGLDVMSTGFTLEKVHKDRQE